MKRFSAFALATVVLVFSPCASAFCRRTTCNAADCPVDENGCIVGGKPVVWQRRMPLTFRFHAPGTALLVNEEARAAVRAAFFRWSDVICEKGRTSLRFVEGEDLTEDKPLTENANAVQSVSPFGIYFRDRGWPHPDQNGDGVLALTTLVFGAESASIEYADIEINTGTRPLTTSEFVPGDDLQAVVTHEVGHYIGLSHSRATNSIMTASLCQSGDRCQRDKVAARRLSDDDRAAVCTLFPPGAEFGGGPPEDSDGCRAAPATTNGLPTFAVVGAALAAFVRARRRRT